MEELVESTYNQIRTYQEELAGAQSQESQLLTEIEQQNEEINSLLRQAKEEEAAAQLAAQKAAEEKAAQEAAARKPRKKQPVRQRRKHSRMLPMRRRRRRKEVHPRTAPLRTPHPVRHLLPRSRKTGTSSQENTSLRQQYAVLCGYFPGKISGKV